MTNIAESLKSRIKLLATTIVEPELYTKIVQDALVLLQTPLDEGGIDTTLVPGVNLRQFVEVGDFFNHPTLRAMFHRAILRHVHRELLEFTFGEERTGKIIIMHGEDLVDICIEVFEPAIQQMDHDKIFSKYATGNYDEVKAQTLVEAATKGMKTAQVEIDTLRARTQPQCTLH